MERIRELRKERGLRQAKLAVMADMDPATLNRLEQGKGKQSADQGVDAPYKRVNGNEKLVRGSYKLNVPRIDGRKRGGLICRQKPKKRAAGGRRTPRGSQRDPGRHSGRVLRKDRPATGIAPVDKC